MTAVTFWDSARAGSPRGTVGQYRYERRAWPATERPPIVPRPAAGRRPPTGCRRCRSARALALVAGALALLALGIVVFTGSGNGRPARPTGEPLPSARASLTHARIYVVRPGDTLWGIATRLDPTGDPRPLVARLEAQVHGGVLQAGQRLVLPGGQRTAYAAGANGP